MGAGGYNSVLCALSLPMIASDQAHQCLLGLALRSGGHDVLVEQGSLFSDQYESKTSTRSVSENPVVGPRASGFLTGKDGEAGPLGIDAAGRSSVGKQAARSQIGFSDRLLVAFLEGTRNIVIRLA